MQEGVEQSGALQNGLNGRTLESPIDSSVLGFYRHKVELLGIDIPNVEEVLLLLTDKYGTIPQSLQHFIRSKYTQCMKLVSTKSPNILNTFVNNLLNNFRNILLKRFGVVLDDKETPLFLNIAKISQEYFNIDLRKPELHTDVILNVRDKYYLDTDFAFRLFIKMCEMGYDPAKLAI